MLLHWNLLGIGFFRLQRVNPELSITWNFPELVSITRTYHKKKKTHKISLSASSPHTLCEHVNRQCSQFLKYKLSSQNSRLVPLPEQGQNQVLRTLFETKPHGNKPRTRQNMFHNTEVLSVLVVGKKAMNETFRTILNSPWHQVK